MRQLNIPGYRVLVGKDYEEMSTLAAYSFVTFAASDRKLNIAITAGTTPKRMYEILAPMVKGNFRNVTYYNFDEIPNPTMDMGITQSNLHKQFFLPAEIEEERIHYLTLDNYMDHDAYLASVGGLDLMIMGLGRDGHFCGNLRNRTHLEDWTVKVDCTQEYMHSLVLEEGYTPVDHFEQCYYVTMGPRSVMHARKLIVIVNGKHKAQILKDVLTQKISMEYPSTVFQLHPDVTFILDEDAASLLEQ